MERYVRIFNEKANQIDTPEFKKWFGKSKVVKSGKPLVVYHGTNNNFTEYRNTKNGIWFISDKDEAKEYGNNVLSCYIRIEKPYMSSHKENTDIGMGRLVSLAKSKGCDGIILPKDIDFYELNIYYEALHTVYICFTSNQIKSAMGNNGMFSSRSNNIYESQFNEEFNQSDYLKWKRKNVTYRGMKKLGTDNEVWGSFGKGLYTVPLSNKAMAKTYGTVYFVVNAIPTKPVVVQSLNSAEIFRQQLVMDFCKKHKREREHDASFFDEHTSMEKELMKQGYDGFIIKGREMVHYAPKNVLYFKTEDEVKGYYETI